MRWSRGGDYILDLAGKKVIACAQCLLCFGLEGEGQPPRECQHDAGDDRIIPLGNEKITDGCPGRQISETSLRFLRACRLLFGTETYSAPMSLSDRLGLPHIFTEAMKYVAQYEREIIQEMKDNPDASF